MKLEERYNVEVLGGCGEYGRNCFYIEKNDKAILFDCGIMKKGEPKYPNLLPEHILKLDKVFISHAHIDHMGALEYLINLGYKGEVIMTDETYSQFGNHSILNEYILNDNNDKEWIIISNDIRFKWGKSGHCPGSVWYVVDFLGEFIYYSGDQVTQSYSLKRAIPPQLPYEVAIIEAGNVEKNINNQETLDNLIMRIENTTRNEVIFLSSYSIRTLDCILYLNQYADIKVEMDYDIRKWIGKISKYKKDFNEEAYNSLLKLNKQSGRVQVYFYKDVNQAIERLGLEEHEVEIISLEKFGENCIYKTHMDHTDVLEQTKWINAKKNIYFHSNYLVKESTIEDIAKMKM